MTVKEALVKAILGGLPTGECSTMMFMCTMGDTELDTAEELLRHVNDNTETTNMLVDFLTNRMSVKSLKLFTDLRFSDFPSVLIDMAFEEVAGD